MINGSGTAYTYDGLGERVIKGGSKLYWKGVGSTALVETDQSGASLSRYIFFNGQRIAREDANPGCGNGFTPPRYYVTDNVGSTSLVTDSIGDVLNESLFFPYGVERIISQNDSGNNYKFSGKERDPETGLDDFGARYYDSALGRFMTPDWDGKPITVPYASFGDPQTLNLYAYVENGPLNRVDADGHAAELLGLNQIIRGIPGVDPACGPSFSGGDPCAEANSGADKATFDANTEATAKQAAASAGNNAAQQTMSPSKPILPPAALPTDITIIPKITVGGQDGAALGTAWSQLMASPTARSDARVAVVKDGSLTVNSATNDAYFDPKDKSLNVDPNFHPKVMTTAGPQASPTSIILGHELGHKLGGKDAGPGNMDNVNTFENPIRRDLGLPARTAYPPIP